MNDQAVIVNVPLQGASGDFDYIEELGERLRERLAESDIGEFDGDVVGEDWGVIYLYGRDADRLWQTVEDLVREASPPAGTNVVKRHGPPGAPEARVDL